MGNFDVSSESEVKKDKVNSSTGILKRTVSGVRNLAVKFATKFNKQDNCKTFHELNESDVVKNKLDLSDKFIERIKKLKRAEGKKRRGQTTGLYMQYILERIIREYYDYKSPIPVVAANQIRNLQKRFKDEHLDVTNLLDNFFDITKKLDPLAPLIAMSYTNSSKKGGGTLRNLYQFLKRKGYDLYTEYRDCIFKLFKSTLQDIQVGIIESEYHVGGSGCRGRIDIYCGEVIIDSKCTIKDGFHCDLSQLLLYKLLAEQNEKQLVKRVMIVNPCLSYVYTVDVSKWAGTHFKELLQKQSKPALPRYQSDSNLKQNVQSDKLQRTKSEKILPRSSSTLFTKKVVDNDNHVNFNETLNNSTSKSRSDVKLTGKSKEIQHYRKYLDKWDKIGAPRRREVFLEAQKVLGEENPLLTITNVETIRQDYNAYQRERKGQDKSEPKRNSSSRRSAENQRNINQEDDPNDLKFMTEMARLNYQKAKSLKEQVREQQESLEKHQATLQEHEGTIKKQQRTILKQQKINSKQQETIERLTEEVEELKIDIKKLMAETNELKRETSELKQGRKDDSEKIVVHEAEIKHIKDELSRERTLREEFERRYKEVNARLLEYESFYQRMNNKPK